MQSGDFGSKTVKVKYKGTQKDSNNMKVFYPGNTANHPGGTTPNWFYYYKDNAGGGAYTYKSTGRSDSASGGGDSTIRIANQAYDAGGEYILTTINSGQLEATGWSTAVYYYASFIGILTHERQHANNEQSPPGGTTDRDSDWLVNGLETGTCSTDPDDKYSARGVLPATFSDDEVYAGGPVEEAAFNSANTSQDWANPGTNY